MNKITQLYPDYKYSHTTQHEIDFLDELSTRKNAPQLLLNYLNAIPKRMDWGNMNIAVIKAHVKGLIAALAL